MLTRYEVLIYYGEFANETLAWGQYRELAQSFPTDIWEETAEVYPNETDTPEEYWIVRAEWRRAVPDAQDME